MEYALGFGQNRQKRMVCFAARTPWVVTFGSALLLAASLENGGIQIQTEAFFWLLKQRQKPTPKRLQRPPKGVTALGVERIWTGFDPKTERKPESIVLC